jgi:hypothetical protein
MMPFRQPIISPASATPPFQPAAFAFLRLSHFADYFDATLASHELMPPTLLRHID